MKVNITGFCILISTIICHLKAQNQNSGNILFNPEWESLKQYECPEWFRNAKFGIWSHWGPQCLPYDAVSDGWCWYARNMYIEGHPDYIHHVKTYGHPSKFGYKDLVQLWKAEKFDPDALMKKYKKAGAKYFVSMGVHHDNFDLWNSKHYKWNAVNMGTKRDIVGEWSAAAKKYGLRFGVSEHLVRAYNWMSTNKGADTKGPLAGIPYDGNDPAYADFYFPKHDDKNYAYPHNPPEWWQKHWFNRITDLIDNYKPDLVYTDGGIPFGETGRELLAYYYNQNSKWHNGTNEAVYNLKDIPFYKGDDGVSYSHGDFMPGIGVPDVERGVLKDIQPEPWQTCTSVGGWFYYKNTKYKTTTEILQMLADIVSKNGCLLLNFTQLPDGTLDPESEKILEELAAWMPVNGEAIFETRPWKIFGEGPSISDGGFMNEFSNKYSSSDIRFTTKNGFLYAIVLGIPDSTLKIISLKSEKVKSVSLLGSNQKIKWKITEERLTIKPVKKWPVKHCVAFKIKLIN